MDTASLHRWQGRNGFIQSPYQFFVFGQFFFFYQVVLRRWLRPADGGIFDSIVTIEGIKRLIGNACGGATMWAMVSDTIDYGEWKTGYRTEGLVNSACSFGYKIGNGLGSALLGLILEIGGYVGDAASQTASALASIRISFVWIPVAVYVIGLIIMKFWQLDKEFDRIIADLKARAAK